MKKLTTLLVLVLCMALVAPCALAQYVPGQTLNQFALEAWNAGKLVKTDMKLGLDLNEEFFGFSAEDQPYLDAAYYLLDAFTLSMGAAKLDNGLRVELGGTLEANSTVTVDAALDVTLDGLAVECSLLPNDKVTVRWETLLALAGVPQEDIELIMALKEADLVSVLGSVMEMVMPYVELVGQTAAPYAETVLNWVNTLSFEQYANLEASENYPATALLLNISVYESDVAKLIVELANQVAQDELVCALIDMLLAETGEDVTTAMLCQALVAEFEQYTTLSQDPINLSIGFDENGAPIYAEFVLTDSEDYTTYAGLFAYPSATNPNATTVDCTVFYMEPDGSIDVAFSYVLNAELDPADAYNYSISGDVMFVADDETVAEAALALNSTPTTKDGMAGYDTDMVFNMNVMDQATMLMAMVAQYAQTADGGETSDIASTMQMYVEGETMTADVEGAMQVMPTEDGFVGVVSVIESMPFAGYDAYEASMIYYTEDLAIAPLNELALESMSDASMNALLNNLMTAAQNLAVSALQALPSDVAQIITE